ncbi:MAG TPA: hypothetical protein VHR66_26200 [Gemmataceae bacterium]|jgi:hypothetical protein|nr:hypothetical protein [Gemmataceae bacterium]
MEIGLQMPGHFTEESMGAAEHIGAVLCGLHRLGLAGKEAAAYTMGRGVR